MPLRPVDRCIREETIIQLPRLACWSHPYLGGGGSAVICDRTGQELLTLFLEGLNGNYGRFFPPNGIRLVGSGLIYLPLGVFVVLRGL